MPRYKRAKTVKKIIIIITKGDQKEEAKNILALGFFVINVAIPQGWTLSVFVFKSHISNQLYNV